MAANHLLYISGGARSGKSRYAEQRALALAGPRSYIATCPIIDDEMATRIDRHRQRRDGQGWHTIEEPQDLTAALQTTRDSRVVLVDCITLWINNLLYAAETELNTIDEGAIQALTLQMIDAARQGERTVIFVSNELGMGIVPAETLSRHYRDLVGRCNQTLAAHADEAVFMVSGLPLTLK
ncbi:bifunctional adenosylcobinamide kinase/adenosylcobinamide-phosphate guanylyltransferase [Desulfuromonas acetoxidans]|uniref:Adenosylcobinamide kinase n=1 Tax=Desulfuromonas acetoxidans (strain DSM 684 / 11070) TaxID=281689 RepID=Q1JZW1_DESA6|nr:bifunctional adenosylcobinamide kinase/adenosylcobinamide-phosphate guanylyltransferase [Desulfuromonas acetoxidans]EAT15781.1 cobalbumin biosynthesis enzyme [Desulfuromonas acetoxidans DSM 684]MBF0645016.1 bifunctional adenosylcobinamide kinase/adenosylcobinamide-phosphate guanylyltransferase [Desulfuromonas acetoxidans]NVD25672.1 bifunctional adenosylcobinamide kinase/adenosylcobinamide-phosphate guanylyltransferase [Desulfuromonas acetoxidans]NVE17725.1 bifunctional adenosylcobinamide kin